MNNFDLSTWVGYGILCATGLIFIWLLMHICDWINAQFLMPVKDD